MEPPVSVPRKPCRPSLAVEGDGNVRDIREWNSQELQAVTADVQPRGKHETSKTTTSLFAERPERSQSEETSTDVNLCQQGSDQRHQRDGS